MGLVVSVFFVSSGKWDSIVVHLSLKAIKRFNSFPQSRAHLLYKLIFDWTLLYKHCNFGQRQASSKMQICTTCADLWVLKSTHIAPSPNTLLLYIYEKRILSILYAVARNLPSSRIGHRLIGGTCNCNRPQIKVE